MKNKVVINKTINDLRKTIIELFKNGAKKAGYVLISLLKLLLENLGGIVVASILVFLGKTLIEAQKTVKALCDADDSKIQEAKVLEAEMKTVLSSNKKTITLNNVVIDSNNNGVKDSDDIVIDGKLFPFIELENGDSILYLNEKGKKKERTLPLAVVNENRDFNIIRAPSNYYSYANYYYAKSLVKPLDDAFFDKISAKVREKAPRE